MSKKRSYPTQRKGRATLGQLHRRHNRMRGNKVTVTYANGDKVVVPSAVFEAPKARGKHGKRKWHITLGRALRGTGFNSYAEYLKSDHWRDLRRRYYDSKLSDKCYVCEKRGVDLHHKTYERLGKEYLSDLVPLCRGHHKAAHEMTAAKGDRNAALWWAAQRLRERARDTGTG